MSNLLKKWRNLSRQNFSKNITKMVTRCNKRSDHFDVAPSETK